LGLNLVILHPAAYTPEEWQRIQTDLPLYLPAIDQIKQIGDALVLQIARPTCFPLPERVTATLSPAVLDGLINTVTLTYHNAGPAAFVADVRQGSRLTLTDGSDKNFTEPLVTPAGETQAVIVPLPEEQTVTEAWLATLRRTIAADASPVHPLTPTNEPGEWQPLGLQFTEGPQLVAYRLPPTSPSVCGVLPLTLKWAGDYQGYTALVQLLDPFGRVVQENRGQLMLSEDSRQLALVGSLPPGRYGLRIRLLDAAGQERWPITGDGVPIPPEQVPPLPLIIQPASPPSSNALPLAEFGGRIQLLAGEVASQEVAAGDWLRFTLLWQSEQRLDTDWTVFTQLLGPDGQVWGQRDNQPGGGWYGTSLWPPGQPVRDDYAFQIQAEAPPGTYRLIAGLYDSQTLERLTTETGADFVEIGTVVVE
jgi:hypothetical protein